MIPGILGFIDGVQNSPAKQLKPGSTVVFTVKSRNSDGSWNLLLGGRELTVRSETTLFPGEHMQARVRAEGGRIYLKLLESEKLARHALTELNLPQTEGHKNVLTALIKTGLPLREELVSHILRQYNGLSRRDTVSARILALIADKGLSFSLEDVEKLIREIAGPAGEEQRGGDRRHGGGQRDEGDRRHGGGQRDEGDRRHGGGERRNEQKERKSKELRHELRKIVERSGGEEEILALFNHIKGKNEHWVAVPLPTFPEGSGSEAILRFRVVQDMSIDRFTFSWFAGDTWHFEGRRSGKKGRLVVYCSDKKVRDKSKQIVETIRKKLHNLSYEIDDTIKETSEFEPFVSDTNSELQGVDTRV